MVGFRSPLQGTHAVIATIENTEAVFEAGAEPVVTGALCLLNLGRPGLPHDASPLKDCRAFSALRGSVRL